MTLRAGWRVFCFLLLALVLGAGAGRAAEPPGIQVEVHGLSGAMLKNVLAYLSIETYRDNSNLTQSLVDRLNARAPVEIRKALEPYGYYAVEVSSDLTTTATGWRAVYTVTPGQPVIVRNVTIQLSGAGRDDTTFTDYLKTLPLKSGDQLNQPAYESIKQTLQELAAHHGYIDARFTRSVLRVDPQKHWADIDLMFDTGEAYYFGEVTFIQNFMRTSFLNRYITFKPGDPYDASQLLNLQYALNDSDYFATVDIKVLRKQAGPDRRIPIQIILTPRNRNRYSLGLGYGTDTGPRATLVWENRRLNGLGHRFNVQIKYSHILETTQINYLVPLSNPTWQQLRYSLGNTRQVLGDGVAYSTAFGVNRNTLLGSWSESQYVNLEQDRSVLDTGSTVSTLLVPGVTFSRGYSNNPSYPTRGFRMSLDMRGSSNKLGSDTSFLQIHFTSKAIYPLAHNTRLLLRGELGATAVSRFAELPLSQRFYTGGDQSVRGYVYNSIGPRDSNGNVIGGKDLMVGSIEFDHQLGPIFGLAAFVDAGNVLNSFQTSLEKGVGIGLRWRTPVGVVRFDVAHPVKRPDLDRFRIHISIGPDL